LVSKRYAELVVLLSTSRTLARVTRQTIKKWKNRDTPEDKSHTPAKTYTTLSPEQELIVVELRKTLLLPTDDLLAVTREFINPADSRAGLGRCLRRHGVLDLRDLVEQEGSAPVTKKTFKDYEPGFVHIDMVIDDKGDDKDGHATNHVSRQCIGFVGKTDNDIIAVTSLWANKRHYYPFDVGPYTLAARLAQGKRDAAFCTTPHIVLGLVKKARTAGFVFEAIVLEQREKNKLDARNWRLQFTFSLLVTAIFMRLSLRWNLFHGIVEKTSLNF
jgi:hypothetical protein